MNRLYFLSLLVLSLLTTPGPLDAQSFSRGSGTGNMNGSLSSSSSTSSIQLGDHVPNELLITFGEEDADKALTGGMPEILEFYTNLGANYQYSPLNKHALVSWEAGLPSGQDLCSLIGDGSTLGTNQAQGTQVDLNYIVGVTNTNLSSQDVNECTTLEDVFLSDQDRDIFGNAPTEEDLRGYSPLATCSTPHTNILPDGGNNLVKVAIIDAAFENNIFTVPSLGGTPVTTTGSTFNINPHGEIIARLIAGQAHAAGVANKIQLTSYPVLNSSLRGSLSDIINALEQALMDDINIVNLSITFPGSLACPTGEVPFFDELFGPIGWEDNTPGTQPDVAAQINSLLYQPLKDLEEANVLVINAAGNDGLQLGAENLAFPAMEAGLNNLITVGALSCAPNTAAGWSNKGSDYIELYAPGSNISPFLDCDFIVDGTSFAAPLVTAAAAIHATTLSSFGIYDLTCYLQSSAEPFEGASWGILNHTINTTCQKSASVPGKSFTANPKVDQLTASPNPFDNELNISLPAGLDGEATTIRLINANGKVMMERSVQGERTTLDTNELPRGVYWVNVRNAKVNQTTTVVRR